MKLWIALAVTACLLLSAAIAQAEIVSLFWPESEDSLLTFTMPDGLTVLTAHVILDIGPDSYNGMEFYAECRNDGDEPICLDCDILCDADGWSEKGRQYLYCNPYVLRPGQTGYLRGYMEFVEYWMVGREYVALEELLRLEIRLFASDESLRIEDDIRMPHVTTSVERLDPPQDSGGIIWQMLRVTITNDSGEDFFDPFIAVGAYDAQGRLLYVPPDGAMDGIEMETVLIIPDGGSLIVDVPVYAGTGEKMEACGEEAAGYRCIVY